MLKRALFCMLIFFGDCSYVSAAEMALAEPVCHIKKLPTELVAKICEQIFFLVPPVPAIDEETGKPLSQPVIEAYRDGGLLFHVAPANVRNIVHFLCTNKTYARYLGCPQFTELLLRLLFKIEDIKTICFDPAKPEFQIPSRLMRFHAGNAAHHLFMLVTANFRTIGVRNWMKQLLAEHPNARKLLAKYLDHKGYQSDPQFLTDIGFPFNTQTDDPTYLMHLLGEMPRHGKRYAKQLFKTLLYLFNKDVAINARHVRRTAVYQAVVSLEQLDDWERTFMEYVILLTILKFSDFDVRAQYPIPACGTLAGEANRLKLPAEFVELLKARNETLLKDALLARQPQIKKLLDIDPIPL